MNSLKPEGECRALAALTESAEQLVELDVPQVDLPVGHANPDHIDCRGLLQHADGRVEVVVIGGKFMHQLALPQIPNAQTAVRGADQNLFLTKIIQIILIKRKNLVQISVRMHDGGDLERGGTLQL